ncbi:DUF3099 domain-containing protein [Cellulomonas alba]|uniref:DUF3099 domain-containing protein n=1 Tax=Cellulomonas alba TaxID=3053467 RepID=A0ABT7SJU8_9CELL|nr:DUF3099 domain-containing protein [Cellulomonas alba]MDM7856461.1 DUF3099 domain-containing protein [Cellulomonas alba]
MSTRKQRAARAPAVPSITNAPEPLADDISRRQVRYLVQMGIRLVCFIGAILTWGHVPLWLSLVFIAAAVVLPYTAVIGANAGRERQDDSASYLEPREIERGPGSGGQLGGGQQ